MYRYFYAWRMDASEALQSTTPVVCLCGSIDCKKETLISRRDPNATHSADHELRLALAACGTSSPPTFSGGELGTTTSEIPGDGNEPT